MKNPHAAELGVDPLVVERVRRALARARGRKGGAAKSERKAEAARQNGKRGGRRKVLQSHE